MATQAKSDPTRRDFLYVATGAVAAVGVAGTVWPLIDQMNPDASVLALASIEFDVGQDTILSATATALAELSGYCGAGFFFNDEINDRLLLEYCDENRGAIASRRV